MSAIPTHIQRRFEQRWAARFALPIASKMVGTKPQHQNPPVARPCVGDKRKPRLAGPNAGTFSALGCLIYRRVDSPVTRLSTDGLGSRRAEAVT
jgi:hypothetical protein